MKTKKKRIFRYTHIFVGISFPVCLFCFSFIQTAKADFPDPIFQESFESLGGISANGGNYSGITLETGKIGQALRMDSNDALSYPTAGHIDFSKGTLQFLASADEGEKTANFIDAVQDKFQFNIQINYGTQAGGLQIMFTVYDSNGAGKQVGILQHNPWPPNEWHSVRVFWDFTIADSDKYMAILVDGTDFNLVKFNPALGSSLPSSFSVRPVEIYAQSAIKMDELKIFGSSILPGTTAPFYDPTDPAKVQTLKDFYSGDGYCEGFETWNDHPDECAKLSDSVNPGVNILFYQKPPFERVYDSTVPDSNEIKSQMDYEAAQGEYKTLFFNIYSRTDLINVRVDSSDFTGSSGTISKSNLDIRVVKNWFQAGNQTWMNILPVYTPELLLPDDQVALDTGNWTGENPPSLPLTGYAQTAVPKFTSKQFALIVKVPADAAPGSYASTVTLKADGISDQHENLNLSVLPFSLKDTGKTYALHYGNYTYPTECNDTLFQAGLRDIRDHGFDGVHINWEFPLQNDPASYENMVQDIKNAGFRIADFVLAPYTTARKDVLTKYGFEPWFFGLDEPDNSTKIITQINDSMNIHSVGGKVTVAIDKTWSDKLDNCSDPIYNSFPAGTCEPLDWADLRVETDGTQNYINGLIAGSIEKISKLETYYWQPRLENPQINRFYAGYYLWNSKLDGISPSYYETETNHHPYNDFDTIDLNGNTSTGDRNELMVYPSQQGPVPTMEWQAMAEGIDDGKYLATWKWYRDHAALKDPDLASQSDAVINNMLDKYKDIYRSTTISMSQYEADRQTVVYEIEKLQAVVGPYDADINQDLKVDTADLDILKTDFLKLTADLANPRSDINGDGQATIKDVGIMMSQWAP